GDLIGSHRLAAGCDRQLLDRIAREFEGRINHSGDEDIGPTWEEQASDVRLHFGADRTVVSGCVPSRAAARRALAVPGEAVDRTGSKHLAVHRMAEGFNAERFEPWTRRLDISSAGRRQQIVDDECHLECAVFRHRTGPQEDADLAVDACIDHGTYIAA